MRTLAVLCDRVGQAGGAERYWETVVPAISARGIAVCLLARVVEPRHGCGVDAVAVAWGDEDADGDAGAARAVADALRAHAPDAVVTASVFDCAVLDAVRGAGAPWLVRVHDHRAFCPTGDRVYPQLPAICEMPMGDACRVATVVRGCVRGPRPASWRAIARREHVRERFSAADRVLVSSEHMRATCAGNGIAPGAIAVTPPPLPDDAYARDPAPPPARATVFFASRPTPRKGLHSLIGALARMPEALRPRLAVAGIAADQDRDAQARAARLGVDVVWHGRLDAPAMRAAIDDASLVAVPSLWPEPFGLVGIEAQARGRPAVAYRVGGIPDWIGGAGVAVPRGDEAALAGAMLTVLDARRWPAFAAAARGRAEAYRLEPHVTRLLELCSAA